MKSKIVSALLLTAMSSYALDINEAIDSAIQNNYNLKQQKYIYEESGLSLDSSYSGYKPKVNLDYSFNKRDNLISTQIKEDSTLSASISYNLFNGFMDKYNIAGNKDLYLSSRFIYEAAKHDLVLEVKKSYIDYLLKQKNSQTFSEALKLYEKQYEDSSNFFNQGLIAQNELLEVEVQMLQATQNLQNAKSNEKIAKHTLENLLGSSIKDEVKTISLDNITDFDKNSIDNRSEIKALELVSKSFINLSKAAKSGYLPKVDASLSFNKYGEDAVLNERSGYPNQTIGTININWNLYNGNKDDSSILIYKKKSAQYMMQIKDLKQQLELQYENAKEQFEVSKLNVKTANKALETAKLNYEIVVNKVQEGLSSNKDLIDANYLLTQSKQNYFSAYYNRYLSVATLQRVLEVK